MGSEMCIRDRSRVARGRRCAYEWGGRRPYRSPGGSVDPSDFADVLASVREFVREQVVPLEDEIEAGDEVPEKLREACKAMGLYGFAIPEEFGGIGLSMAEEVERFRAALPEPEPARVVVRPRALGDSGFTVEPDPEVEDAFVVRGDKPERWVRQTQFDNDEAVGFLADRLAKLGVEEELADPEQMPDSPELAQDPAS